MGVSDLLGAEVIWSYFAETIGLIWFAFSWVAILFVTGKTLFDYTEECDD